MSSLDVRGEIVKAAFQMAHGDTLEWDVASEDDRDEMRAVAAEYEPILRRGAEQIAAWVDKTKGSP